MMQQTVVHYSTCVDIYYIAFALLVGCPISRLKKWPKFEQKVLIDIVQASKQMVVCGEAINIILVMLKSNIELSGPRCCIAYLSHLTCPLTYNGPPGGQVERRDGEGGNVQSLSDDPNSPEHVFTEKPSEEFHAAILQAVVYLFDSCMNFQVLHHCCCCCCSSSVSFGSSTALNPSFYPLLNASQTATVRVASVPGTTGRLAVPSGSAGRNDR